MLRRVAILAIVLTAWVACAGPGSANARPHPHVSTFAVPLPGRHDLARTAGRAVTTKVVAPGRSFDLVGLRWRDHGAVGATVRVRHGRRWSHWVPLADADDHGPDGTGATRGTDPVWAGGADALQLRMRRWPQGVRVELVRVTHRVRPAAGRRGPVARAATGTRAAAHAAIVTGPPPMITRAQWDPTNQCPPRTEPSYGRVDFAFVHHTVSVNAYGPLDSASIVLAICRYHRDDNHWNDIGYNFLVDRYGQLFEGRAGGIDQPVIGAQAQGFNGVSTSVSNIGTFTTEPQTDAAMEAMANLLAWKLPLHGVPVTGQVPEVSGGGSQNRFAYGTPVTFERISGHRDGGKTECPGEMLYAQLPHLRELTAARAPAPGTFAPPTPVESTAPAAVTLTARATRRVLAGRATVLRGRVSPHKPRLTAQLAVQDAGKRWHQVRRVAVRARAGAFRASIRLRRPALYRLRVTVPADRSTAAGRAPDVFVRAVRPRPLTGGRGARAAR
jgi:hypothetical protein